MINFRYHIVSLVAVFLALALGVVLGSGPLQSQIDASWRSPGGTDTATLEKDLETAEHTVSAQDQAITTLGGKVLAGSLKDLPVALLTAPGASEKDIETVTKTLGNAGAKVVGQIGLTEYWEGQGYAPYRDTIASPVSSNLQGGGGTGSSDEVISRGIVQLMTNPESAKGLLPAILTDEATPLIEMVTDPKGAAQAVVFVGAGASAAAAGDGSQSGSVEADPAGTATTVWAGMAQALSTLKAAVIVGDAQSEDTPLAKLRATGSPVATVDGVDTTMAAMTAALVLADPATGEGDWGTQEGAEAVLPPLK